MSLLRINKLEKGMRIKSDVIAPSGRFILSAGSLVEDRHIRIFKSWGVVEVRVEQDSPPETLSKASPLSAANMTKVLAYIDHLFSLCDAGTPVVKELRRIATVRIIKKVLDHDTDTVTEIFSEKEDSSNITIKKNNETITDIINKNFSLDSFLNIYVKIRDILKDPTSSISEIVKVIEKDPVVSFQILKVANSVYYGFSSKVSTLERAVTILGGREISSIVAGITAIQYFDDTHRDIISLKTFCLNSVSCGIFARFIADEIHLSSDDDFFLSGLLKDIGVLLILKIYPLEFKAILQKASRGKKSLEFYEKEFLGFSHIDLGEAFLCKYNFPPSIINIVSYVNNPMSSPSPLEASVVHLASVLSFAVLNGWSSKISVPELDNDAWRELNISHNALDTLISRAERQINEVSSAFLE